MYEFAGYKLGMNTAAELPWEFAEKMRSGIQPLIVYSITKLLNGISIVNPFTISTIIRCTQALFSFFVMLQFLKTMESEMRSPRRIAWLYGFSLLFWCLPYLHVRFSSENFSATLFLLGLTIILNTLKKRSSAGIFLAAGILFGIAFESRFQTCFMIIGLFAWLLFVRKAKFSLLFACAFGIIISLGIGLLVDYWLYDQWVLSWWNYLDLNLFKDKASSFGREPFYFFITQSLLQLIPPFSLIIIFCVVAFWLKFKTHVLTWITIPFILLHFFVAHKELRFLFPVLNFLPFMILYYVQSIDNSPGWFTALLKNRKFQKFTVSVNTLLLVYYMFKPADNAGPVLKNMYYLANGKPITVLFEASDPYTDSHSLHYFRNPLVKTINIKKDSLYVPTSPDTYFFSETFSRSDLIIRQHAVFIKQYSSFPLWFKYLNFNGWVERSDPFSVYKIAEAIKK